MEDRTINRLRVGFFTWTKGGSISYCWILQWFKVQHVAQETWTLSYGPVIAAGLSLFLTRQNTQFGGFGHKAVFYLKKNTTTIFCPLRNVELHLCRFNGVFLLRPLFLDWLCRFTAPGLGWRSLSRDTMSV